MKKIIGGLVVLLTCICLNTTITKATTYQADELVKGQKFEVGDIIELGSGIYKGRPYFSIYAQENYRHNYNTFATSDTGMIPTTTRITFREPMYVSNNGISSARANQLDGSYYDFLQIHVCKVYIEIPENISSKGEDIEIIANCEGGTPPYNYHWYLYGIDNGFEQIDTTNNKISLEYGKYKEVRVSAEDSSETYDDGFYPGYSNYCKINNIVEEKPIEEDKSEEKPHNEPTKTPEQIESERKNKDTLPTGTIQGIGGKKDFNFKALNPVQRDVNNQQIFADYYAKQLGFKSELLISKAIYAPYGQTKESKWQSRTISWKNTGAKFGDLIYVVWYCQEAHEMQFIQANVLPDGTVVFTIPKSGDVSTISIVKLNK